MSTKRTPIRRDVRLTITPEAVEAYRANDYGRLNRALGLKPWEQSPLWVDGPEPPEHRRDPWRVAAWRKAWELRCELEAAQ